MEINADFTQLDHINRETDSYAQLKYRITLRWLQKTGLGRSTKILNVGCGAGDFNVLAESQGFSVDGIEPDANALELARKRCNPGSMLESIGIFDFKPKTKYQFVVMHDVLEHLENDAEALEKLKSFMSMDQEANLVISVPAHQWLFGIHDESLGHYRRYSKRGLIELLQTSFEIINVRSTGLLGIPAALVFSRWLRRPYPLGKPGFAGKLMALSCVLEEFLAPPWGSSLLVMVRPKN